MKNFTSLGDVEDELGRYRTESKKLISSIQRITGDLDNETIRRIELETQKQNLQKELEFLRQLHAEEIQELKQINLKGTTLDPTIFFKHELADAVKNIRKEYEQINYQQRHELELWYHSKVSQAVR